MCAPTAPALARCRTIRLADAEASGSVAGRLLATLPAPTGALSFFSDNGGLVGFGEHAAIRYAGDDAAAVIADWYAEQLTRIDIDDGVQRPGSGPVCFVSLGFSPADVSVAVIPRTVIATGPYGTFRTTIGAGTLSGPPEPVVPPGEVRYHDAALSTASFAAAVRAAVGRIRAGHAAKVVLAHGLQAVTDHPVDERFLMAALAARYPSCVTFAVDGLVGASPELLIRRRGRHISSRVLAGTAWPDRAAHGDGSVAARLLASDKDVGEHRLAVSSVADVLRGVTDALTVPSAPNALPLANLTHLATDIAGTVDAAHAATSALDIAALLHPSAAVGGTPRPVALALIAELEPDARGRYAAPVGWIDARGDGDFAIALRCAQIDGRSVRLMAGCGIVADSDPDTEAREAQIKMIPVRDALEG